MIETEAGKFYTGITKDLLRRYKEHRTGNGGAKFFRQSPPKEVAYIETAKDRSEATRREMEIKKLPVAKKLALFGSSET